MGNSHEGKKPGEWSTPETSGEVSGDSRTEPAIPDVEPLSTLEPSNVEPEEKIKETTRAEQREALLDTLEKKVDILDSCRQVVDSIDPNASEVEVRQKFEQFYTGVVNRSSPQAREHIHELEALDRQWKEETSALRQAKRNGDVEVAQQLEVKKQQTDSRRRDLLQDNEVLFLDTLSRSLFDNLLEKLRLVQAYKKSEPRMRRDLERATKGRISLEGAQIRFDPFAVVVETELSSDPDDLGYYDRWTDTSIDATVPDGLYFRSTPFIAVEQSLSKKRSEDVLEHERMHNMLDHAEPVWGSNILPMITEKIRKYDPDLGEEGVSLRFLKFLEGVKGRDIVNSVWEHILTNIDKVGKTKRKSDVWSSIEADVSEFEQLLIFILNPKVLPNEYEPRKKRLNTLVDRLQDDFFQSWKTLRRSLRASAQEMQQCSPEERTRAEQLFFILPPAKYHHIPRFIRERIRKPTLKSSEAG